MKVTRPPRDDLFRALIPVADGPPPMGLRADREGDGRTLFGHFAVFDRWTEIDSYWEGHFLERIAHGAFKKTFREQRDQLRVLFQHGYDPEIGDKPIASLVELREDETGAYYEARLLDGVPDLIVSGLRAGVYGASFRFRVMREEFVENPGESEHNPRGLPERTIKELALREFGPVTWGAYPDATSGLRSVTDDYVLDRLARDPERLRHLLDLRAERVKGAGADGPPAPEDNLPISFTATGDAAERAEGREEAPDEGAAAPADADTADARREHEPAQEPGNKPTPQPGALFTGRPPTGPSWRL